MEIEMSGDDDLSSSFLAYGFTMGGLFLYAQHGRMMLGAW
jgi:hypothetical protein